MNITVIFIEIIIMMICFGALAFGLLLISPLTFISDYPKDIQEEYYRSQHKIDQKKKLSAIMIIKKVFAIIIFIFLFAWLLHLAGAKTFLEGVLLTWIYVLCIFAFDTFFLDWFLFSNIKRIRLPGTEHMDKEYHQKWFHVKVCLPMIPVFILVSLVSSGLLLLFW